MPQPQAQHSPARHEAEQLTQYLVPAESLNILRNLETIIRLLMSLTAVTLDVFTRREFGERHLTVARILFGWIVLQLFLGFANLQTLFSWIPGVQPLPSERTINSTFVTLFLVLSVVHLLRIWQRNRAGIVWYSHSFGISWFDFLTRLPTMHIGAYELRITDWVLYRFIEPSICLLIAYYVVPGPSFTRNWLIGCSIAMLIHNNLIFNARRSRFLDMLDSQIESGYYNTVRDEALGTSSKYQTAGHATMPLPPKPVIDMMAQADIALTVRQTVPGLDQGLAQTDANILETDPS